MIMPSAPIIPLDPWRARLRRDMAAHGLREAVRRIIASSDAVLDSRAVAEERAVLRRDAGTRNCRGVRRE